MKNSPQAALTTLRATRPLVHNITNYVVMNFTANALLALGASPVMAHAAEEVDEMVALSGALVINIGTLSTPWVSAMQQAMQTAARLGKPIILDPVGAGATSFRNQVLVQLLAQATPTVIRGNASEIRALAGLTGSTRGVDSTDSSLQSIEAARILHDRHGCVVSVSGAVDVVLDGKQVALIENGHSVMSQVTGMGCSASSVAAAFCAGGGSMFEAAVAAATTMGVCGEMAAERSTLPGSFQIHFLDALAEISPELLTEKAKIAWQEI
ncbi:hydroxyethylthiazole kinase [Arundinibacter roseus]|uniref:Hydroxyethylthiazole kinase n=1 Tax=Arundinibacter roseus TaxID=2070510 RepID=A0A4V6P8R1_9BACT|nr:hydroxyethylthiazole kinase [Arundinibacter roseus]TDB68105.1 hydroxyethylthiazole kinase [Arundinibacter roseus]